MEAMIATPVTRMQLLLGKLIPYFCMGMFSMALCALAAVTLFEVPFRGSLWVLLVLSTVFMLSALGQGLLISVCLRGQLVAAGRYLAPAARRRRRGCSLAFCPRSCFPASCSTSTACPWRSRR